MLDDKQKLEELYSKMSLTEMSKHLGIAKSTLHYRMKKLGIGRRSKADAQKRHAKENGHQRIGQRHSTDSKLKISKSKQVFWESDTGKKRKEELADLRKEEWDKFTEKQRATVINKMNQASRPVAGELSKLGKSLLDFLVSLNVKVNAGIDLINNHHSDIIIEDMKVVVELVLPFDTYGEETANKLADRYDSIARDLNDIGYKVLIVQDSSNAISRARCQRIYDSIQSFVSGPEQRLIIKS